MADPTPAMTPEKPVKYAEDILSVHGAYTNASLAADEVASSLEGLNDAHAELRQVRATLEDHENDLAGAERASNPELSQAAFDRHLKTVIHNDERARALRRQILDAQGRVDERDAAVEVAKIRARIAVARLEELGGLLTFYAARTPPPKEQK